MVNRLISLMSETIRQHVQKITATATILAGFLIVFASPVQAQVTATPVLYTEGASITKTSVAMPAITSPASGASFASPVPVISGAVVDTTEVLVFIDGRLNGTTPVVDGTFRYTPFLPLASGEHQVQVRAQGPEGGMSVFSATVTFSIIPNPSPTLLMPKREQKLGQDRAWVGGVAQNDSLIRILVDGTEYARTNVQNHTSGIGSFGVNLSGLSLGNHVVTAIARNAQGKESFKSNARIITIVPPTPSPILFRPVVNGSAGIERPFVTGLVKNNSEVSIVMNGKIETTFTPEANESGVASFSWQPENRLALGTYTFEAFASDNGKLSNNSAKQVWQVGDPELIAKLEGEPRLKVTDKEDEAMSMMEETPITVMESETTGGVGGPEPIEPTESPLKVTEPEEGAKPLTVQDSLVGETKDDAVMETPLVDDADEKTPGRVVADDDTASTLAAADDLGEKQALNVTDDSTATPVLTEEDDVDEVAPGAVTRRVSEREKQEGEFTFNTSLIIGIVILVFLLLSILVWYIQEKKEALGQRMTDIFKEDVENGKKDTSNMTSDPEKIVIESHEHKKKTNDPLQAGKKDEPNPKSTTGNDDLPPPPPPMF